MTDIKFGSFEIEIGELTSPIEGFIRGFRSQSGNEQTIQLLELALELSRESSRLAAVKNNARRELHLSVDELHHLAGLSAEAGEESYGDWYAIGQVLLAAAITSCDVSARIGFSANASISAKRKGQYEGARRAYADSLESAEIMSRFFRVDESWIAEAFERIEEGWNEVRDQSERSLNVLDPSGHDPAEEWAELVLWNLDEGSSQGVIAQVDATIRLVVHMEHWSDQLGKSAEHVVESLLEELRKRANGDGYLLARCYMTVGDALMELSKWELAADIHREVPNLFSDALSHPMGLHSLSQEALCHLMVEEIERCRACLAQVDSRQLERMSELIATMQSEFVRYLAVDCRCRERENTAPLSETWTKINSIMRSIGPILARNENNRTTYMRMLYYAVLVRDLESLSS